MTPPTTPAAPSVTIIYPPKDMPKPTLTVDKALDDYFSTPTVGAFEAHILHLQSLNHYDKLSDLPDFDLKVNRAHKRGSSERRRRMQITQNASYHAKLSQQKPSLHEYVPARTQNLKHGGHQAL